MTTPTTTETEDISTRLAVLETEVRNINTRLDDTNSLLERMHSEQQAENRAMRAEFQAENRPCAPSSRPNCAPSTTALTVLPPASSASSGP